MATQPTSSKDASIIDRLLRLFSDVRAGEGFTALLLMGNLFLLLTSYLIIKVVREALILGEGGAVVKSYAAAGQALLLLVIVPIYSVVASRVRRIQLINGVTSFCILVFFLFYLFGRLGFALGVPFFLWVGIFNLFVVAQFWSFANDLYSEEQGKRLFPIIAFGGGLGAILGPKMASMLFQSLGGAGLMLLAGAILFLCIIMANWIHRRVTIGQAAAKAASLPLNNQGAFQLVVGQRYFLLIAGLMVILNLVNTTGEYILGQKVTEEAQRFAAVETVAAPSDGQTTPPKAAAELKAKQYIASFYGDFLALVSLLSALAQLFLVSRILKFFGVPASLFFMPLIVFGSYSLVAIAPVLASIRLAKVLENSTDYSLQNTVRQALFLPTSREAKYKAKAAIDTFFVRIGDLLSTGLVFLSVQLSLTSRTLSIINLSLVVLWLLLITQIGPSYKALATAENPKERQ
ncbi:MAG: carrier protein [Deltaproteobacteria bacterium]|nr:carrier protein [Deltaproteobacteria bacterium]